jgi:flavin-binding protein dodecin
LSRAGKTVRALRWFEVIETRGKVAGKEVRRWQVTISVGFSLEDA